MPVCSLKEELSHLSHGPHGLPWWAAGSGLWENSSPSRDWTLLKGKQRETAGKGLWQAPAWPLAFCPGSRRAQSPGGPYRTDRQAGVRGTDIPMDRWGPTAGTACRLTPCRAWVRASGRGGGHRGPCPTAPRRLPWWPAGWVLMAACDIPVQTCGCWRQRRDSPPGAPALPHSPAEGRSPPRCFICFSALSALQHAGHPLTRNLAPQWPRLPSAPPQAGT